MYFHLKMEDETSILEAAVSKKESGFVLVKMLPVQVCLLLLD